MLYAPVSSNQNYIHFLSPVLFKQHTLKQCLLLHFVHRLRDFCPEVIDNRIQLVKSKLLQKNNKKLYYIKNASITFPQ